MRVTVRFTVVAGLVGLLISSGGCMSLAKKWAVKTGQGQAGVASATVVGYMRYYVVHSTYAEIMRVDSEAVGGSSYAVSVVPGPRLVSVYLSQVGAMNPLIFGASPCAFEIVAEAGTTYTLTPPSLAAYAGFWSRPPGIKPLRFQTSFELKVSSESADSWYLKVPAECGRHDFCRTGSDCGYPLTGGSVPDPAQRSCYHDDEHLFGVCDIASQ